MPGDDVSGKGTTIYPTSHYQDAGKRASIMQAPLRPIDAGMTNYQLRRRGRVMNGNVVGDITDGTNVCSLFHIEGDSKGILGLKQ